MSTPTPVEGARQVVLEVPAPRIGPHVWLSSNQRTHYLVRSRYTRLWRHQAHELAEHQRIAPFTGRVHVVATIHRATNRRRDVANLYPTVKAIIDGIRDAGVLIDDDDAHLTGPDMRPGETATPLTERVVITITEVAE